MGSRITPADKAKTGNARVAKLEEKVEMKIKKLVALTSLAALSGATYATNGMNMEGYGPVATAMGGAAMAYDNGTAATMNNPATLGLMAQGSRVDLAVGMLGPDVSAKMAGMPDAESGGDAYYMPALGWARKSGAMTFGLGVFSQGGMGTEYGANSFMALGSGQEVRSELGVGRVIVPLAFEVSKDFTVGGSLDFVWAGLDLKMAATGAQLGGMVTGGSGALFGALPGLGAAPWARIDFSDGSDFTGEATGTGFAAKVGFVWKAMPSLSVGGVYQSKTNLNDLETGAGGASMSAAGGFLDTGTIKVEDFQWPEIYAMGAAFQATPQLMLVGDVKKIGWKAVMDKFRMTYTSQGIGGTVSFAMDQNWEDQTVYSLGAQYALNPEMMLRAGANISDNPIPNTYLNALFPAIVEDHYMAGFGYTFSKASSVDFSFTYAPEVSATAASGVISTHAQTNWQFLYSYRY